MSALLRHFLLVIVALGFLTVELESTDPGDKEWWETTLVYQIWPRGFQDSDGDGEGDLNGIINRLDYIKNLGVDTIWLNPIYSSPLIDSGYDVSNYTDINPVFGSLDHFDQLVQEAHDRELKVILDIVPNHSSDDHEWFQLSSQNVEPYNDYYVWANGSTDENDQNAPPNNWASVYSKNAGSAWSWHDGRQQWYYHKFHESQPDLNLRNDNVVRELLDVFDFWLKRNVDGFRINAVPYFYEDENLQDEPSAGKESNTFGLQENTELLYMFRAFIDYWVDSNNSTSKLLIAESHDSDDNIMTYYGNGTHEGIPPFNFRFITHIHNSSDAKYIKNILEEWFDKLPDNASTNWVLSNHDYSRAASRIGLNRVDGLHMLSLLLPGQAYTYYGDEIAMLDTKVSWNETIDPIGCSKTKETYEQYSRDPSRTPMQWNSETSAGFSTNNKTYLPIHPNYVDRNVEEQSNKNRSNINTYKQLTALRKNPVFTHGDYEFATVNDNHVLILKRFLENHPVYIVAINLGLRQEQINITSLYPEVEETMSIAVASSNAVYIQETVSRNGFLLTANAALVLKADVTEETTTELITEPTTTTEEEETTTYASEKYSSTTEEVNTTTENESTTSEVETTTSLTVSPIETTTTGEISTTTEAESSAMSTLPSSFQIMISATLSVIVLFRF